MFTLQVLSENNDRHLSVKQIIELMHSHEWNTLNGKVRRTFTRYSVSMNLKAYSATGYRLFTKSKQRKIQKGRQPHLYKISKKGKKFLSKYKNRFLRGHSAVLPNHSHKKGRVPYELRLSTRHGVNHTKTLMIKKSDGFKFIFGECFKNEWNRTAGLTG